MFIVPALLAVRLLCDHKFCIAISAAATVYYYACRLPAAQAGRPCLPGIQFTGIQGGILKQVLLDKQGYQGMQIATPFSGHSQHRVMTRKRLRRLLY
jgi:hypothetical protein